MNSRQFSNLRLFIIISFFWGIHMNVSGQFKNLEVGDKFNFPIVDSVLNVPNGTLDFASYKGKLIILDFWGPGCASCIAAFPKLDSLQRIHSDVLQIIAVNKQSRRSTLSYLEKLKTTRAPTFPMVTSDSLLHYMFPHAFVPHHVWIDTVGRVLFITSGANTNGKHIRDYFNGKTPEILNIQNSETSGLVSSLLIEPAEAYEPRYSLLTKAIPGISTLNSVPMARMGKITRNRVARSNASLIDLYSIAYSKGGIYNFQSPESWEIDDTDRKKFIKPEADSLYNEWYANYCYHYDLRVPKNLAPSIYRFMQEDLDRYFEIEVEVVLRRRKVYLLKIIDKTLFAQKASELPLRSSPVDEVIYFRNWDMLSFTVYLQKMLLNNDLSDIVVNDTNFQGSFTIALHNKFLTEFSISLLNQELRKYGLELEHRWRKVPILSLKAAR